MNNHGLTKAQIKALRHFAQPWRERLRADGPRPASRTHARLESMGLTAWNAGASGCDEGRDETTAAGLAVLAKIDAAKP